MLSFITTISEHDKLLLYYLEDLFKAAQKPKLVTFVGIHKTISILKRTKARYNDIEYSFAFFYFHKDKGSFRTTVSSLVLEANA